MDGYHQINIKVSLYTHDASTCFLSLCSFLSLILPIVLSSRLLSDVYVYGLCCSVSPTNLVKMRFLFGLFFERNAGGQTQTRHVGEGDLT